MVEGIGGSKDNARLKEKCTFANSIQMCKEFQTTVEMVDKASMELQFVLDGGSSSAMDGNQKENKKYFHIVGASGGSNDHVAKDDDDLKDYMALVEAWVLLLPGSQ